MAPQATVLDNPLWHALTNQQASFALGDERARRFPPDLTPGAAVVANEEAAFRALAELMSPDETLVVVGSDLKHGELLEIAGQFPLLQMIYDGPTLSSAPSDAVKPLSGSDVPAILDLIANAQPGPFLPRCLELGPYLAIWQEGQLASMAGVRLHLPGYREICTVCTHTNFLRRGYARQVVSQLVQEIQLDDEIPFLSVFGDNTGAIALYKSLGFEVRAELQVVVVKRK